MQPLIMLVHRRASTVRRAVHEAHRQGGWRAAGTEVAQLSAELVARPARRWREQRLDRRLNLDTRADAGSLHPSDAGAGVAIFDDAVGYSPIPVHHFRKLLHRLPIGDPSKFTFVDLGCGKGRTLVIAAEHGFRPVVGVELDSRLSHIALGNAEAYRAASQHTEPVISVVNVDAAEYALPAVPAVLFLFNPFGPDTLSSVLSNLERSLKESPRRLLVAYFNPVHRQVFESSSALRETAVARHWTLYESAT